MTDPVEVFELISASTMKRRFQAVATHRESRVQPLLLVFEDLHWVDSETQALLDRLVESLPTTQILLLVNYRPEYQHGWGSKTFYTQLRLDPLPPESADACLAALLGDHPSLESLKKLLVERAEGNPFFLEESVRALVEIQVLVGEAGAYRLGRELLAMHVPPTVQAVLAARIDRLSQDEKRLLQTAAVIGTEMPLPLLQAIADLSEETLYRGLTHLQRRCKGIRLPIWKSPFTCRMILHKCYRGKISRVIC
jgi:predicted ATPase